MLIDNSISEVRGSNLDVFIKDQDFLASVSNFKFVKSH